jgi:hypothetical protein
VVHNFLHGHARLLKVRDPAWCSADRFIICFSENLKHYKQRAQAKFNNIRRCSAEFAWGSLQVAFLVDLGLASAALVVPLHPKERLPALRALVHRCCSLGLGCRTETQASIGTGIILAREDIQVTYREGVTVDDVCLVPATGGRGDHRRRRGRGLVFLVK